MNGIATFSGITTYQANDKHVLEFNATEGSNSIVGISSEFQVGWDKISSLNWSISGGESTDVEFAIAGNKFEIELFFLDKYENHIN